MSTSCYIGILQNDNKVKYVYCHFDGYLHKMGSILQLGYTTAEKVNALINLGNISAIGYNINAPKKFKDLAELYKHHIYCKQHFKTTFVVSYIRDMNYKAEADEKAKICSLKTFCKRTFHGYIFDPVKQCWLATLNGSEPVNLKKLLTDKAYYLNFKNAAQYADTWEKIKETYESFKADLACKGEHSIIRRYNNWMSNTPLGYGVTFGYAVRNGVRMYALLPKYKESNKRRKALMCSEYIGDLVACVLDGEAQQLL